MPDLPADQRRVNLGFSFMTCHHCSKEAELIPFVNLLENPNHRYTEADFVQLCPACHTQHSHFRELKPELLPYWAIIAMRLRDFIPPAWQPPPVKIKPVPKPDAQILLL